MNKPFGRIENLGKFSQVQIFTNPVDTVTIMAYTLDESDRNYMKSEGGIALSPEATLLVLNMLKEWEQYAIEHKILEKEI
ncbi:hypothetical protein LCGC14_1215330 [marine sediment metagenome]|uniref:Uncharacterized protein n=1 Tax=marine sediment metagenome TaxID=412755 RepID=A0A0F9M0D5_9ZZZZ